MGLDLFDMFYIDYVSRKRVEAQERALKRELDRIEYEKQQEKLSKEIRHLKFASMEAQEKHAKAIEMHKQATDNLKHFYLKNYLGCEEFEEMCERMDLITKESWDKLVDALPKFAIFNEDHEKYLKKLQLSSQTAIRNENESQIPIKETNAAKFCGNCGAPIIGGKFCKNCGKRLV